MMDAQIIAELRDRLLAKGSVKITDSQGRRLYLVHTRLLGEDFDGVMVAYEGKGAFVFNRDRPVNKFRLINHGFDMAVAEAVADLINRVVQGDMAPAVTNSAVNPRRPKAIEQRKSKE